MKITLQSFLDDRAFRANLNAYDETEARKRPDRIRIGRSPHRVRVRVTIHGPDAMEAFCKAHFGSMNRDWMWFYEWSTNISVFIFIDPNAAFQFKMTFG
jgi:hypothetical protein